MFVVVEAPFAGLPNTLDVVEPFAGAPNEKPDAPAGLTPKGLDAVGVLFVLPLGCADDAPPKLNEKAGLSDFSFDALGVVGVGAPPEPNPNKGFGTSAGFELVLPKGDGAPMAGLEVLPNTALVGAGLGELAGVLPPPPNLKENCGALVVFEAEGAAGVALVVAELAAEGKLKPEFGAGEAGVVGLPNEVDGKVIFGAEGAVINELPDVAPNPKAGAAGLADAAGVVNAAGAEEASGLVNPNENFGAVDDTAAEGVPAGVVDAALGGSAAGVAGLGWLKKENPAEGVELGVEEAGLGPKLNPPGVVDGADGVDCANAFDGAGLEVFACELFGWAAPLILNIGPPEDDVDGREGLGAKMRAGLGVGVN